MKRARGSAVVVALAFAWGAGCGSCNDRPGAAGDVDAGALVDADADGEGGRVRFLPGDAADPATMIDYCGSASGSDLTAPWPGPHGCTTNPARTRYLGPRRGVTLLVSAHDFTDVVFTAVNANHVAFHSAGGAAGIGTFDLTTGAVIDAELVDRPSGCWLGPRFAVCLAACAADELDHLLFWDTFGKRQRLVDGPWKGNCGSAMTLGPGDDVAIAHLEDPVLGMIGADGGARWAWTADAGPIGDPVPSRDGTMLFAEIFTNAKVPRSAMVALDERTGALVWQSDEASYATLPVVAPDDRVYVVANEADGGSLLRARTPDGGVALEVRLDGSPVAYPLAIGGPRASEFVVLAYMEAPTRHLTAIRADGTIAWTLAPGGPPLIVDAEGFIYTMVDKTVSAITPDGAVLWSADVPATAKYVALPVIGADGALFVATDLGLYRFGP